MLLSELITTNLAELCPCSNFLHNTTMRQRCWCISNCHIASASVNSRSLCSAVSLCLNRDKVRGGHAHRVASAMQGTMKSGMSYCTERWEEDRMVSHPVQAPCTQEKPGAALLFRKKQVANKADICSMYTQPP